MEIDAKVMMIKAEEINADVRNQFIADYMPFIVNKISNITGRYIEKENDEEFIVGLEAFNESIDKYDDSKGKFLGFAEMVIKNRITDYLRKQSRHNSNVAYDSEHEPVQQGDMEADIILKQEVYAFKNKLAQFGLTPDDLVDNAPKQDRTMKKVTGIGHQASMSETVTNKMYLTKKLPMAEILKIVHTTKRILKSYRDFIVGVIIVYHEKYEVICDFLLSPEER